MYDSTGMWPQQRITLNFFVSGVLFPEVSGSPVLSSSSTLRIIAVLFRGEKLHVGGKSKSKVRGNVSFIVFHCSLATLLTGVVVLPQIGY